jgi:hypothetical protein
VTADISPAELEQFEAESLASWESAASAEAKAALGIRELRVGGGVAMVMPKDEMGYWSRTLGLGFTEPVTATLLEQIIRFYGEQGATSARFHIAPHVLPPDWVDICAKLNISEAGSAWVKLAGPLESVTAGVIARGGVSAYLDTGLRFEKIGPARAREWASVMWDVFQFPPEHQVEMGVGVVGRPDWGAFAVLEGDEIVAVGALRASGRIGQLLGGATKARVRGRGAQSALIAGRAVAAREAGCDWLIGETGAEGPGQHNPSLHNMLRAGMQVHYVRPSWIARVPQ